MTSWHHGDELMKIIFHKGVSWSLFFFFILYNSHMPMNTIYYLLHSSDFYPFIAAFHVYEGAQVFITAAISFPSMSLFSSLKNSRVSEKPQLHL